MLTSRKEIANAVKDKYQNAEKLSIVNVTVDDDIEHRCSYSHDINNIGCGVSCLFNYEDAQEFERLFGNVPIGKALDTVEGFEIVSKYVSVNPETADALLDMQTFHDGSLTPNEFRHKLTTYLVGGTITQ